MNTELQGIQNYKKYRTTRNTELCEIQNYNEYRTTGNTENYI